MDFRGPRFAASATLCHRKDAPKETLLDPGWLLLNENLGPPPTLCWPEKCSSLFIFYVSRRKPGTITHCLLAQECAALHPICLDTGFLSIENSPLAINKTAAHHRQALLCIWMCFMGVFAGSLSMVLFLASWERDGFWALCFLYLVIKWMFPQTYVLCFL